MSLTLHFHPLSSFCHKVLIALYENGTPFTPKLVNLQDEGERAAFHALWPVGKFPVLQDSARDCVVPESSIIIEYLDRHYPGATKFIPDDPEQARAVRSADRFYDLHIHLHMQKIVGDRLRPANAKDRHGVEDARTRMAAALGIVEKEMASRTWAAGELRGRTRAVLCRQGHAAGRQVSEPCRLPRPPEAAPVPCAHAAGGGAVLQILPEKRRRLTGRPNGGQKKRNETNGFGIPRSRRNLSTKLSIQPLPVRRLVKRTVQATGWLT